MTDQERAEEIVFNPHPQKATTYVLILESLAAVRAEERELAAHHLEMARQNKVADMEMLRAEIERLRGELAAAKAALSGIVTAYDVSDASLVAEREGLLEKRIDAARAAVAPSERQEGE